MSRKWQAHSRLHSVQREDEIAPEKFHIKILLTLLNFVNFKILLSLNYIPSYVRIGAMRKLDI